MYCAIVLFFGLIFSIKHLMNFPVLASILCLIGIFLPLSFQIFIVIFTIGYTVFVNLYYSD